jgi:hypothetical protein
MINIRLKQLSKPSNARALYFFWHRQRTRDDTSNQDFMRRFAGISLPANSFVKSSRSTPNLSQPPTNDSQPSQYPVSCRIRVTANYIQYYLITSNTLQPAPPQVLSTAGCAKYSVLACKID